jgi:hypothetical protein
MNTNLRLFVFLLFTQVPEALSQESKLVYSEPSEAFIKQLVILDESTSVGLIQGKGQFKLTNTLVLIRGGEIIDNYVHNSTIDYIYILSNEMFAVFRPLGSQLLFAVKENKLKLIEMEKIPFYKRLSSTSSKEGLLALHNDLGLYFDQGTEVKKINRYDSNSTPNYFAYYKGERIIINKPPYVVEYEHWPTYSRVVTPPMNYIRIIGDEVVFTISNLGVNYILNTVTREISEIEFPHKSGVVSWSLFYDHLKNKYYNVAYLGDDSFEIFERGGDLNNSVTVTGFSDSIVNGMILQKVKSNGRSDYTLIKIGQ